MAGDAVRCARYGTLLVELELKLWAHRTKTEEPLSASEVLLALSQTPRFDMTVMFMSSNERGKVSKALAGWAEGSVSKKFA